jgi:putative nucleotidyltransferase with HDIG domain
MRILLVDDEPTFRALLRATFETVSVTVDEADHAIGAKTLIDSEHPDVVVLDVRMPGVDGLAFCRELKDDSETSDIRVILLTGADETTEAEAEAAGADAFMRKPFSPLELLAVAERVVGAPLAVPIARQQPTVAPPDQQLLLYARDLRNLLELERGQRLALQGAYKETVEALGSALASRDFGTGAHSERVHCYALELARAVDPELDADPSAEYGFLLHDVGKIGIPDEILRKEGPLTPDERRVMQNHTVLGEQMLGSVGFLQGSGLEIVRHHHERWDGAGYPDGLSGREIPLGARVFAVADALDAMTTDRPYRRACSWESARAEIGENAERQFDPEVVDAFEQIESNLRQMRLRLTSPVEARSANGRR